MADDLSIEFDFTALGPAISELVAATGKDSRAEFRNQCRLLMLEVIDLTPPSGGGNTGAAAKKLGVASVDADLTGPRGLFVGVRIKGRRKITMVFGRKLKKPIYVKTKEKWPDVQAIYNARMGKRFNPSWSLDSKSRGQAGAYYVDKAKLAVLRAQQVKKVGKLASGWLPAVRALGGKVLEWIARQPGTRGRISLDLASDAPELEAAAEVKGQMLSLLQNRVNKAVVIRTNTIRRELPHILEKAIRKAKL